MHDKKDLMSMAELKSMLSIYGDEYYVDFGDRYLCKVDDHDTDVVQFQWIDKWEHDAIRKGENYYSKFEELEPRAEQLLRNYAQKEVAEGITVNWIFPYPINEELRRVFMRCYNARVPFTEYFKVMRGYDAEIYVVDMAGKWHELRALPMIV